MMTSSSIAWLTGLTISSSLAIMVVLAIRQPVRSRFGPVNTYILWLAVPLAIVAWSLPRFDSSAPDQQTLVVLPESLTVPVTHASSAAQDTGWLLPLWLTGSVLAAIGISIRQVRFRRMIRPLTRLDRRTWQSASDGHGPVVVGWLPPRILLPAHFDRMYSPLQQELILCHERMHIRHGDPVWGVLAAALQCICWYNPLVHIAVSVFRRDQELACDQSVMQMRPGTRRTYAEALLAAQADGHSSLIGSHAFGQPPLKERITMLATPVSLRARIAGLILCSSLLGLTSIAVWAIGPASTASHAGPDFNVEIDLITANTSHAQERWVSKPTSIDLSDSQIPGHFADALESDDVPGLLLTLPETDSGWSAEVGVARITDEHYVILATIREFDEVTATPKMIVKGGQWGSVSVSADESSDPRFSLAILVEPGGQ